MVAQFSLNAAGIRSAAAEITGHPVADGSHELDDRLWDACRVQSRPRLDELAHRIGTHDGKMVLSIRVPFADRDELTLKKVGQELIVRAGREKRTIILPPALSRHRPSGAKLEGGNLEVSFEDERQAAAGDTAAAQEPTPTAGAAGA